MTITIVDILKEIDAIIADARDEIKCAWDEDEKREPRAVVQALNQLKGFIGTGYIY